MKISKFFSGTREDLLHESTFCKKEVSKTIKIMTLNIAHGRANGSHQLFQTRKNIEKNLTKIGEVVKKKDIDILCLQEVDNVSFWSGKFNHARFISKLTNLQNLLQGFHVKGLKLAYGTAILSKFNFSNPLTRAFKPVPPLFTKGFVSANVKIGEKNIHIVSLHFDFARKNVRKNQAKYIMDFYKNRENSLIICGDFNTDFYARDEVIKQMLHVLNLKAYKLEDKSLFTFALTKKRIDWILISKDLDFISHEVIDENLSDHLGVCCELAL